MKRIKSGDTVKIIAGDDKGKTAKVMRGSYKHNMVILEGIRERERHAKKSERNPYGTQSIQLGLHMSNIKLESRGEPVKKAKTAEADKKPAKKSKKETK